MRLFLVAVLSLPAAAQFSGLASDNKGTTLYFSTTLRLRGSADAFDAKLYRIAGAGPELFRSLDHGQPIAWTFTNFYNLTAPVVSSDGTVVAYSGRRPCTGGSGCLAVQTTRGSVLNAAGKEVYTADGYADLSPNGRYAFFYGRNTFASIVPPAEFVDLNTMTRATVPYSAGAAARHRVANDGTVAVRSGSSIRLWRADGDESISGVSIAAAGSGREPFLGISADAQRLVYQTSSGLAVYDRGPKVERQIAAGPIAFAAMNDDASVVAYVNSADSQVYLAQASWQLTREAEGIAEVALSGDGRIAFAATQAGRLLRIDVGNGIVTELVPRTPWITSSPPEGLAPGSLVQLTGTGLSAGTQVASPPLPLSMAGVRVRIAGVDAPLQTVTPDLAWFQVPWELPLQDGARFEFLSGDSPFETGPGEVDVPAAAPHTIGTVDTSNGYSVYSLAVHQDWSALVTPASPAQPGEIIHLYFTGLGAVSPAVATGVAAPSDPLSRLVTPLRCTFWDSTPNEAAIWYAGLAPGMAGIYQVSVQVPAGLRMSNPGLICDYGPDTPSSFGSTFVAQ